MRFNKRFVCGLVAAALVLPALMWLLPADIVVADEVQDDIIGASRAHSLGYNGAGFLIGDAGMGLDTGSNATLFPDFAGRVRFWNDWVEGTTTDGVGEDGYGSGTHFYSWMAGNGANGTIDPMDGKLYGEGVAPNSSIIVERIFGDTGNWFGGNILDVWRDASQKGAYGIYNPWVGGTINNYETNSYNVDVATRDADSTLSGDQPLLLVIAGGNYDILATGCNKNGITAGGSESYKPHKSASADNINEWASWSADGPTADGRIKPDLVAPSTWGAGVKSHSSTATYLGLQQISADYIYDSGSGGAAAIICGASALFAGYYNQTRGASPSPAMTKAAFINGATDMDDSVNTAPIPNGREGWGRLNLTNVIAPGFDVFYDDQSSPLADNTQKAYTNISVTDDSRPFKVTLVWTDYPAPTSTGAGRSLINDLNLTVISPGGTEYHGNQFTYGWSNSSMTGYDTANNVECVYVQAPQLGTWTVRVNADDIRSDAVSATPQVDQDYALVASGEISVGGGPVVTSAYADPNPTNGAVASTLYAAISGLASISGAEYFIGATGANGTGTAMSPSDGLFNSTFESAYGTINIAAQGWLPGEAHTIYVHALDSAGRWGDYNDVTLYIGTGYFLHVETSLGANMSLLKVAPDETSVATSSTANLVAAGQYRIGSAAWISEAFASTTNIGGTWRYVMHGMVSTNEAVGFLYAKVFKYGTMTQINTAPAQCPTNVSGKYAYYAFEWSEAMPASTISAGDRIYVELWLNATDGGGGNGMTQYTFAGVTQASGNDALFCDVDDDSQTEMSGPNSATELTDAEYIAISTSNNVYATSLDPGNQDEMLVRYRFQIAEPKTSITGMTLSHEALYSAAVTCTLYAYNYTGAVWTQVGTTQSFAANVEGTMTRTVTSGFADYISTAGGLNWGVYASARATCSVDFAYGNISYSLPYPTFTLGYDNASAPSLVVVPENIGAEPAAPFCNITVQLGWNLVSIPYAGPTAMPSVLMDKANGGAGLVAWDRAMWYDPSRPADPWRQYYTGWNSSLNDLTDVNRTMGIWLNVTSMGDGLLCLGGTGYSIPTATAIPLHVGWNLIGFPSDDTTYTVGQLKADTMNMVIIVEGFNSSATYKTSALGDSTVMLMGRGYWVYCVSDISWIKTW